MAACGCAAITDGFAPLWREQLGGACPSWPAIADEAARWRLRAAMDVVVALAYGLDRAQYERVLSSFSHKSFPSAPGLCLAAFDELMRKGNAAFCAKHDPYFGLPLVTTSAAPVIENPVSPETRRDIIKPPDNGRPPRQPPKLVLLIPAPERYAVEKTRTSTGLPPQAPQACASTIPPRPPGQAAGYTGCATPLQLPAVGAEAHQLVTPPPQPSPAARERECGQSPTAVVSGNSPPC